MLINNFLLPIPLLLLAIFCQVKCADILPANPNQGAIPSRSNGRQSMPINENFGDETIMMSEDANGGENIVIREGGRQGLGQSNNPPTGEANEQVGSGRLLRWDESNEFQSKFSQSPTWPHPQRNGIGRIGWRHSGCCGWLMRENNL